MRLARSPGQWLHTVDLKRTLLQPRCVVECNALVLDRQGQDRLFYPCDAGCSFAFAPQPRPQSLQLAPSPVDLGGAKALLPKTRHDELEHELPGRVQLAPGSFDAHEPPGAEVVHPLRLNLLARRPAEALAIGETVILLTRPPYIPTSRIGTPAKGRGGAARMAVSPTARAAAPAARSAIDPCIGHSSTASPTTTPTKSCTKSEWDMPG